MCNVMILFARKISIVMILFGEGCVKLWFCL